MKTIGISWEYHRKIIGILRETKFHPRDTIVTPEIQSRKTNWPPRDATLWCKMILWVYSYKSMCLLIVYSYKLCGWPPPPSLSLDGGAIMRKAKPPLTFFVFSKHLPLRFLYFRFSSSSCDFYVFDVFPLLFSMFSCLFLMISNVFHWFSIHFYELVLIS